MFSTLKLSIASRGFCESFKRVMMAASRNGFVLPSTIIECVTCMARLAVNSKRRRSMDGPRRQCTPHSQTLAMEGYQCLAVHPQRCESGTAPSSGLAKYCAYV
ncbi:hypothetical protein IG631_23573 [Alternaria alternata]|nr:hypothetical protein IG631_23573 [Alternaria alternata]